MSNEPREGPRVESLSHSVSVLKRLVCFQWNLRYLSLTTRDKHIHSPLGLWAVVCQNCTQIQNIRHLFNVCKNKKEGLPHIGTSPLGSVNSTYSDSNLPVGC